MSTHDRIQRVILVVLDGLRPDAITTLPLPGLIRLADQGAHSYHGTTVTPSITAAAVASLFTGVAPAIHGVRSDRIGLPRPSETLMLLPRLLRRHGHPVFGHMASLPRAFQGLGGRLAAHAGAAVIFEGANSEEILDRALPTLERQQRGLTFLHWPDADLAGHRHGWMTAEYAVGAHQLDRSLTRLVEITGVLDDPDTVLIAVADHGGGGDDLRDHNSGHPLDTTIPVLIVGGQIVNAELPPGVSLLDIPATIAWLLGVTPPASYQGRVLSEALLLRKAA